MTQGTIIVGDVFKIVGHDGKQVALVSCSNVATKLGVHPRRVTRAVADGVLKGAKIGREWFVSEEHFKRVEAAGGWESLGIRRGKPRTESVVPKRKP